MTKPHKQQFSTYAKGFGGPASGWKRFTKAIAWLLLLSFVANILNVLVAPKTAQAVDVNDHMLLFWPSTNCADTPADWTAVSDGGGEAFTSIFPRGAASYSASAGGSADHTHTATVTQTGITGSASKSNAGSTQEIKTHTHTNNSANVDNISSLPKYREMCVIKYDNGIPNGNSAIPNGAVAIFDAAPPAGWSDYSSTFSAGSDTFIRGGTNGTGGSNSHQGTGHTI